MNICYKVVRLYHEKISYNSSVPYFTSSSVSIETRLKYEIGSKTTPIIPHSKIFVFKNIKDATSFKAHSPSCESLFILRCRCGELKQRRKKVVWWTRDFEDITDFWAGELQNFILTSPIKGTYLTNWVIPIEIVR